MDRAFYGELGHQEIQQQQQQPPSSSGSSGPPRPLSASLQKKRETRRRTKTGCLTCRKRRIKCDEAKPECMRCIKSKRNCEGYSVKTVFRNENQLHYQQSIRPSPASQSIPPNGYLPPGQPIQFSVPQYQTSIGGPDAHYHAFAAPQFGNNGNFAAAVQSKAKATSDPASRNSSASNASGVSANSEQRRISVLSLMSSEKNASSEPNEFFQTHPKKQFQAPLRTPETDARDNYYYNYYVSCHSYSLAKFMTNNTSIDPTSRDHPSILWPQTVPSLINEDPPGRRSLFDAIIAYTAHIRFEEIPIDFEIHSSGSQARLIELGLKAYVDIIRGTSETISKIDTFFLGDDPIRVSIRWGLLQHVIIHILSDTEARVPWINALGTKAFTTSAYQPSSEIEHFYLEALRHITTNNTQIPSSILDLQHRYNFLSVPGMDIIYFAFIQDYDALRNIAYHILSNPRLEYLNMAYHMINGVRLRGEPDLDLLANELMIAIRQAS